MLGRAIQNSTANLILLRMLNMPLNGLAHLLPVSGADVANARYVTDTSGGQCSDLLGITSSRLELRTRLRAQMLEPTVPMRWHHSTQGRVGLFSIVPCERPASG